MSRAGVLDRRPIFGDRERSERRERARRAREADARALLAAERRVWAARYDLARETGHIDTWTTIYTADYAHGWAHCLVRFAPGLKDELDATVALASGLSHLAPRR